MWYCCLATGVLRYSLHRLFAVKCFACELLLLRNGARWTVLQSKVLVLSAEQPWCRQWHSTFSSSVSLYHQPDLRRQRIPQKLCLLKENSVGATCWSSGFGDVVTDASSDLFLEAAWDQSLGSLLKLLISHRWWQCF